MEAEVFVALGGNIRSLTLFDRQRGRGNEIRNGARGGRDVNGTKRSMAAIKCMLFLSLTEPRRIFAAENVETRSALSSPMKRGGKSFGRMYDMLYPLTMMCPVYLSSKGGLAVPVEVEDDERLECTDAVETETPNKER